MLSGGAAAPAGAGAGAAVAPVTRRLEGGTIGGRPAGREEGVARVRVDEVRSTAGGDTWSGSCNTEYSETADTKHSRKPTFDQLDLPRLSDYYLNAAIAEHTN